MSNYTDKIDAENDGDTRGDAASATGHAPVGYRNPPRQHQFKKGHSGNKPGRKKGSRNLLSVFKDVAEEKIKVKIGGKDVEVCCEECATKLREASAKQKKKA